MMQSRVARAALALLALGSIGGNCGPRPDCATDNDCCARGPAYLCQSNVCTFNQFVQADPNVLAYRQMVCSGGGADGGAISCAGNPEILGTQELAQTSITNDACELTTTQEANYCASMDGQLYAMPTTPAWQGLVTQMKSDASISPSVDVVVTPDLQAIVPYGGGVTGTTIVVLDGKFIDILAEYSTYLAMRDAGQTTVDDVTAIDEIVYNHNSVHGQSAPATVFPPSALSPSGTQAAARYLEDFAGAIMSHEYGHFWSWACVDRLRAQYTVAGQYYFYPSKLEDDADLIAGVLSAKAGHDMTRAEQMIDLMAFYTMNRQGAATTYSQVAQDYQTQFLQMNPSYSSLAVRKQLIARGYADFQAYGH